MQSALDSAFSKPFSAARATSSFASVTLRMAAGLPSFRRWTGQTVFEGHTDQRLFSPLQHIDLRRQPPDLGLAVHSRERLISAAVALLDLKRQRFRSASCSPPVRPPGSGEARAVRCRTVWSPFGYRSVEDLSLCAHIVALKEARYKKRKEKDRSTQWERSIAKTSVVGSAALENHEVRGDEQAGWLVDRKPMCLIVFPMGPVGVLPHFTVESSHSRNDLLH